MVLCVLGKSKPGIFVIFLACTYAIHALAVLLQLTLHLQQPEQSLSFPLPFVNGAHFVRQAMTCYSIFVSLYDRWDSTS